MCGDIAVMLILSPPPLAAVWEVPARRFRRRVGALVIVRPTRGARGTVLAQQSGSFAILAAIRRASLSSKRRKRTPSGETAWGPEVLQFRLWAEQRGCRGDGEPPGPPKLCDLTGHAAAKTITPLYSTDYLFVSFSVRAEKCNSPRCLR